MKYLIEKQNTQTAVKISGVVNIQSVNGLKTVILDLLKKENEISLLNNEITEIDLTYYQFLIALNKTAKIGNKKINIIGGAGAFQKLYDEIGVRNNYTIEKIYGE